MRHQKKPKVVVIGAGFSGLTTAYRLQEKGWDVEVYEARNRVGGRIFTVNIDGHTAELGAQNILDGGEAKHLLRLVDEVGLETKIRRQKLSLTYFENDQLTDIKSLFHYNPQELKLKLQSAAESANNLRDVLLTLFEPGDIRYKACSVMLAGYEGAPIEQLSPVYIETLYHYLIGGLSAAHQSSTLIEHQVIKGGNALLVEKMAAKLQGKLYLNHFLNEIDKLSNGKYVLSFKNGLKVEADITILTIPCPVYKNIAISEKIMPEGRKSAIENILYGTNAKIVVPVKPLKDYIGGTTNGRIVAFLNTDENLINMYFTEHYGKFDKDTIDQAYNNNISLIEKNYQLQSSRKPVVALEQPFGFYASPVGHSWVNDPFAMGSYSCVGAGQEDTFLSMSDVKGEKVKSLFEPIDGTLYFAGEHTSILLDVGGTMEAAVESAERTVRLIEKLF